MKKNILILIIFSIFNAAEVTNITVSQRTDGSGIVDVNYDLLDPDETFPSFTIEIEMSIDDESFTSVSLGVMNGDVGDNVIPGSGKNIQIYVDGGIYSTNVVVKIIASAHLVTSELPFIIISISSAEGQSSYQDIPIEYNFDIMQNELTNAELVTFLETYEFSLNENEEPVYDCNNYTEYFNSGDGGSGDAVFGCTEEGALNYNPEANVHTECIYEHQLGCQESEANNFNGDVEYDDCSCYYTYTEEGGDAYSWVTMPGCNWTTHDDTWEAEMLTAEFSDWFGFLNFNMLEIDLCDNPDAQNYPHHLQELLMNYSNVDGGIQVHESCWSFVGFDSCIYQDDCDMSYLNPPDGDGSDFGSVNINDFSTQSISYEGASFLINSGEGTQPALFNYDNCVDGVIVGLFLDYYGLRIPNGEEWVKAARFDNDKCWPWMQYDCDTELQNYCEALYTCMSEEEFDECQENANELFMECQLECNSTMWECQDNCMGGGDDDEFECDTTENIEVCISYDNCSWDGLECVNNCDVCMSDPINWDTCINQDTDGDGDPNPNPCNPGCSCCETCNHGGGDFDSECMEECNNESTVCNNDCGTTFGNTYEYCNGDELNQCTGTYEDCLYNNYGCEQIEQWELYQIINDYEAYEGDAHGFKSYVYTNKFNYIFNGEDYAYDDSIPLTLNNIAQYPEGVSSFGLYDMIGNAPELVTFNNKLWIVGLSALASDHINSFCNSSGVIFDDMGSGNAQGLSDTPQGDYFPKYGLRLVRTTQ